MAALLLSYLSPFHSSSSSNSNKNNHRKNHRLTDANDPMVLLSPQVGCLGQIKTRNNHSLHGARKRKQKAESNILIKCLAPLFKGSSKVRDIPRSVNKMLVNNVSITEMDPPLPVRMIKQEDLYKVSLWERRFGGKELGKLELMEKRRRMTTIADICFFS